MADYFMLTDKLGKWKKLSGFTNADRYKQSVWNLSWYVDKGGFKDGKDNR